MICKICSNKEFKNLFYIQDLKHNTTNNKFLVKKCQKCGVLIVTENNVEVNGSLYYPDDYSAFDKIENIRKNIDKIYPFQVVKGRLAWAKKVQIERGAKLLDVGCGNGNNMLFLKNKYGCEIIGIEPSYKAAIEGKKAGLDIYNGMLDDFSTNNKFYVVYLLHVIEHLENPRETLKKIYEILENNGKIVIGTPNVNSLERYLFREYWDGWDTPRHIYMFRPKVLKSLLEEIGFNEIEIYYEIYSLFGRSFNNIFKKRGIKLNKYINAIAFRINFVLSYILPFLKFSSAVQIIAQKKV